MASLLIISSDYFSIEKVERLCFRMHIRSIAAPTVEDAEFLLNKEEFVGVFVDTNLIKDNAPQLAHDIWSKTPLCFVGVFSFSDRVYSEAMLRLIGVGVFYGENAFAAMQTVIQNLPLVKSPKKHRQILYVEDLSSARKIVSTYIDSLGYGAVIAVESAQQALVVLDSDVDKYFCVLTDINMPEISGIELTRYIRNQPKFQHLPIIVITSFGHAENLIDCIKAGATGFLVKPPRQEDIRKELDKAVRIIINKLSPRLCSPDKAFLLEESLLKMQSQRRS